LPPRRPLSTRSPYTTLFRSSGSESEMDYPYGSESPGRSSSAELQGPSQSSRDKGTIAIKEFTRVFKEMEAHDPEKAKEYALERRSEEHTSELQSREKLVCRL